MQDVGNLPLNIISMLKSTTYIKNKINITPNIAIVLGSGLSDLEEILNNKIEIQYKDIPEYNDTTVEGHKGKFICGDLYGKSILLANNKNLCTISNHVVRSNASPLPLAATLPICLLRQR